LFTLFDEHQVTVGARAFVKAFDPRRAVSDDDDRSRHVFLGGASST